MNSEVTWAMVHRIESAAETMSRSADRAEEAARRIALLLEDGYGGNGLRLIELLEKAETQRAEPPELPKPSPWQAERFKDAAYREGWNDCLAAIRSKKNG